MTKCSVHNCNNNVFGSFDKCALHCPKGEYQSDSLSGLLLEFSKLLNKYIVAQLINVFTSVGNLSRVSFISSLNTSNKFLFEHAINPTLTGILRNEVLYLFGIHFPMRKPQDTFDYFKFFKIFKGVYFDECFFYLNRFSDIGETEVFFEGCVFKSYFEIHPMNLLSDKSKSLFDSCTFEDNCEIGASQDKNTFEVALFSGGGFKKYLNVKKVVLKKEAFTDSDTKLLYINDYFSIEESIIEDRFILNKTTIKNLVIAKSLFKSKVELKGDIINDVSIVDSNFDGILDCHGSIFEKFQMIQATLNNFVIFEKVIFGKENTYTTEYETRFIYTTFTNFLNFRETIFYSGLDIKKINFSPDFQPNFLEAKVPSQNTNRETFRIIKKSFDELGNHIEANKYFSEEMKAYRNEINSDKNKADFWTRTVVNLNYEISNFGQNYINPIILLFLFSSVFTSINTLHGIIYEFLAKYVYNCVPCLEDLSNWVNRLAKNIMPFSSFLEKSEGIEFISLIFYIIFSILIWQIFIAVKRKVIRE